MKKNLNELFFKTNISLSEWITDQIALQEQVDVTFLVFLRFWRLTWHKGILKVRHATRPCLVHWTAHGKHFLLDMNVPHTVNPPLTFLQRRLLPSHLWQLSAEPTYTSDHLWANRERVAQLMLLNSALQGSFPIAAGRTECATVLWTSHPGSLWRIHGWPCCLSMSIAFLPTPFPQLVSSLLPG